MFKKLFAVLTVATVFSLSPKAYAESDTSAVAPIINYFPNRLFDFTDMFNVGVSFGPTIGLDISLSDKVQIGYMAYSGSGYTWLGRKNIRAHNGSGQTYGLFLYRYDSNADNKEMAFLRDDARFSVQVGIGLVQVYGAIKLDEALDFLLGLILIDPKGDDELTESYIPLFKLSRGVKNVLFAPLEIPFNIVDSSKISPFNGYIFGTLQGISRFIQREIVGFYELATFYIPQNTIIAPETPFDSPTYEWQYNWD